MQRTAVAIILKTRDKHMLGGELFKPLAKLRWVHVSHICGPRVET